MSKLYDQCLPALLSVDSFSPVASSSDISDIFLCSLIYERYYRFKSTLKNKQRTESHSFDYEIVRNHLESNMRKCQYNVYFILDVLIISSPTSIPITAVISPSMKALFQTWFSIIRLHHIHYQAADAGVPASHCSTRLATNRQGEYSTYRTHPHTS